MARRWHDRRRRDNATARDLLRPPHHGTSLTTSARHRYRYSAFHAARPF